MSWEKIEEHLFDKYCVEGRDDALAELMAEHDAEVERKVLKELVGRLEEKREVFAERWNRRGDIQDYGYFSGYKDTVKIVKELAEELGRGCTPRNEYTAAPVEKVATIAGEILEEYEEAFEELGR